MPRTARPSIATHYLRYAVGNALILLAGFISYPILTRLLSYAQYGVLGYFDAWMLFLTAAIKLGSQHSAVRFYPHGADKGALRTYASTFVLYSMAISGGVWLLAALILAAATLTGFVGQHIEAWVMLVLLVPTVCISYVTSVLTAEERSDLSVRFDVVQRWIELVAILGIIYFISRTAAGVYVARLLAATAVAAVGIVWLVRNLPMSWRDRDVKRWLDGVRYGVPMGANELAYVVLGFVDRLMLKQQLQDFVPVGIYTIGYGLALKINVMLHAALGVAYNQVSIRLYETEGPEAVVKTKRSVLDVLVYVVSALIVGTLTVGKNLLLLLAGNDKSQSVPVFIWVAVTYIMSGLLGLCASGLVLHKRSATLLTLTVVAAITNIVLNLFWIPKYGFMAAVYATAISLIGLNLLQFAFCPRSLRALPSRRALLIATGLGFTVWVVAQLGGTYVSGNLTRLLAMTVLMGLIFVLPALAFDRSLRATLHGYWMKRRAGEL